MIKKNARLKQSTGLLEAGYYAYNIKSKGVGDVQNKIIKNALLALLVVALAITGHALYNKSNHKAPTAQPIHTSTPTLVPTQSATLTPKTKIVVTLSGEVKNPGRYEIEEGSSVLDAILLAGGLKKSGTVEEIDIDAILQNGQRIHIPKK